MVKGFVAAAVKVMPLTSVVAERNRVVIFDRPNVAVSADPLGTVGASNSLRYSSRTKKRTRKRIEEFSEINTHAGALAGIVRLTARKTRSTFAIARSLRQRQRK